MAATACSAVLVPVVLVPSTAWAEAPSPSACTGLYHGSPPGSLAMTTSPPSGSVLHPGDEVEVTATWDTADWPGPVLHKVLDCLLVDGTVDYERSRQEKPTDNDGLFRYRFTVPAGTSRICDRVRLSGRFVEDSDLVVQKSNTVCFSVAAAGRAGPGLVPDATTQGATTQGATSPADATGPVDAGPAPLQPADPPAEAAAAAPPASELAQAVVVQPMLPRTGGEFLPLARLGAFLVLCGGAALAARAALSRQGVQALLPD
jgi:hypothetical protein